MGKRHRVVKKQINKKAQLYKTCIECEYCYEDCNVRECMAKIPSDCYPKPVLSFRELVEKLQEELE